MQGFTLNKKTNATQRIREKAGDSTYWALAVSLSIPSEPDIQSQHDGSRL